MFSSPPPSLTLSIQMLLTKSKMSHTNERLQRDKITKNIIKKFKNKINTFY